MSGVLPQVQEAAQPDTWLARLVRGAVRKRDRPPCSEQFLNRESSVVIGGGDLHDRESRLCHMCLVDRFHTQHDAPVLAGVLTPGSVTRPGRERD